MWCSPMFPCLPFAPALSASPNIYRPVLCLLSKHRSQRFLKQQPQLCRRQPQKSHPTSSRYFQSSEKVHLTVFPAFEFFYRCSEVLGTDRLYGEPADDVLSHSLVSNFQAERSVPVRLFPVEQVVLFALT